MTIAIGRLMKAAKYFNVLVFERLAAERVLYGDAKPFAADKGRFFALLGLGPGEANFPRRSCGIVGDAGVAGHVNKSSRSSWSPEQRGRDTLAFGTTEIKVQDTMSSTDLCSRRCWSNCRCQQTSWDRWCDFC
jgi:hypothetical protein